MNRSIKNRFFALVAEEMVVVYNVTMEVALNAIKESKVNAWIDKYPEYVDHVPLSDWAKKVYEEICMVPA